MPQLIQDEFAKLDISPQRRYQLRKKRDGCCRICGAPRLAPYEYCEKHYHDQKRYTRTGSYAPHLTELLRKPRAVRAKDII
jgi:hypothetical protein